MWYTTDCPVQAPFDYIMADRGYNIELGQHSKCITMSVPSKYKQLLILFSDMDGKEGIHQTNDSMSYIRNFVNLHQQRNHIQQA